MKINCNKLKLKSVLEIKLLTTKKIKAMRTLLLTILLTIFCTGYVSAFSPDSFSEILKKEIQYPEFAKKNNIEGVVLVSFFVDDGGFVNIEQTNASNEDLRNYVVDRLKNFIVSDNNKMNITHYMRFEFKLV